MPRKSQTRVSGNTTETPNTDEFTKNKIFLDELISVMSLIDYPLNLLQQNNGRAKYRFEKFGQVKEILYQDILTILENYQSFLESGYFVILDKRVVDRHGLQEISRKVLKKDQIAKIIEGTDEAVQLYKTCSNEQQRLIIGMLTRKLTDDPQSVDLNVVDSISRLAKINIQQNAEDARELYAKKEEAVT